MKTIACTGRFFAALLGLTAVPGAGAASAESGAVPKPFSQEWAADPPKIEDSCEPADDRYAAAPLFRIAAPCPGFLPAPPA